MTSPVLHVLAGPNGAGKSTFVQAVLQPITHLRFINADEIAAQQWPGEESEHAYEASTAAAAARDDTISHRHSFITETVFSHPSKIALIKQGISAGYIVTLHVMLVPEDVAVLRVAYRVALGGHTVPETKVRERYRRLWSLVAVARDLADRSIFYDNSRASTPFVPIASYDNGRLVGDSAWPVWTPAEIVEPR
ncbi:zeta toxin family protein [Rathayibacter soli]|uniref:zeta toxin family protein n=1 Tax=Rathayibacter soli TaxID=3144168 RepID=UPI0027E55934|nr:zeta toxin family protein [Glaciibacter superstes]